MFPIMIIETRQHTHTQPQLNKAKPTRLDEWQLSFGEYVEKKC